MIFWNEKRISSTVTYGSHTIKEGFGTNIQNFENMHNKMLLMLKKQNQLIRIKLCHSMKKPFRITVTQKICFWNTNVCYGVL